jgi:hypothetical protein
MARPIKLVKKQVLEDIYKKYTLGVPLSLLIREYKLSISRPSLANLVSYCKQRDTSIDDNEKHTINDSLYPVWTKDKKASSVITAIGHKYIGQMPLGYWETNDCFNK